MNRARFLRPRWLAPLFNECFGREVEAADFTLAARAWRCLGVRCFVPAQPRDSRELWGSAEEDDPASNLLTGSVLHDQMQDSELVVQAEIASGWEPLVRRPTWDLFLNHLRYPRNRGKLDGRVVTGTTRVQAGEPTLSLSLKLSRSPAGTILIDRAAFEFELAGGHPMAACASWLTETLPGMLFGVARGLEADDLLRGLGVGVDRVACHYGGMTFPGGSIDDLTEAAESVVAALRMALTQL